MIAAGEVDPGDLRRRLTVEDLAILDGELYRLQMDGLVSAHEGWSCPYADGEQAADFAERSRGMARRFVEGRSPDGTDLFFLFRFSRQEDAV